jgi:hypothetical protein
LTAEPKPRRIGRRALLLAAMALAGSTAFLTWWTTTLMGLPDVGDPFDVEAFSRPIPDDTNAFILYRQASTILPKEPEMAVYDWKEAGPDHRAWHDRGREALAIWRKGTERPDALYINPGALTFETKLDVVWGLRSLGRLALIEGSRLEDSGDFEGALDWYIALLRSSRHCGTRGTFIERLVGIAIHRWVSTRLIRWAADPKVDDGLLRKALDAAIAADAATAQTSDGLKVEYLSFLHSLDDPELMIRILDSNAVTPGTTGQSGTVLANDRLRTSLLRVRRRALNEPERSRRVIRMIFANWLAYCDLPVPQQPPRVLPNPKITSKSPAKALLADLYAIDDTAPAPARALAPEKLANWFASTVDAEIALPAFAGIHKAIARERSAQDALLFTLANELYQREHGHHPEHNEELVGPYLKALPEGYRTPR